MDEGDNLEFKGVDLDNKEDVVEEVLDLWVNEDVVVVVQEGTKLETNVFGNVENMVQKRTKVGSNIVQESTNVGTNMGDDGTNYNNEENVGDEGTNCDIKDNVGTTEGLGCNQAEVKVVNGN